MGTSKLVTSDDTKSVYRVLLLPFGSPDERDLDREYFDKDTDFGDLKVGDKVFTFYGHNRNHLKNPAAKEGDLYFGKNTTFVEQDDRGLWFDIEIDRIHKYHDAIAKLDEKGYLGASGGSFYPGKENDPEKEGRITKFHLWEGSLTGYPASFATKLGYQKEFESAIDDYNSIMKEFGLDQFILEKNAAIESSDEATLEEQVTSILDGTHLPAEDIEPAAEDVSDPVESESFVTSESLNTVTQVLLDMIDKRFADTLEVFDKRFTEISTPLVKSVEDQKTVMLKFAHELRGIKPNVVQEPQKIEKNFEMSDSPINRSYFNDFGDNAPGS